jgi:thymidylate synthase ThyX
MEHGVNDTVNEMNEELTLLAGKAAGVCYMPDDYMENGIQNKERAIARAKQTALSGHHSVYDHGHITFVLKTNKMMAMILNSLGVYATSEKSARYTKMKPETELEKTVYEKWTEKIQELILDKYPNFDDIELQKKFNKWFEEYSEGRQETPTICDGVFENCNDVICKKKLEELKALDTLPSVKMAMENARYMISVFTPTTMMYTVSFRQALLTVDYLKGLSIMLEYCTDKFSEKLKPYVDEMYRLLKNAVGEIRLTDNKNQYIRFLEAQHSGEFASKITSGKAFVEYKDMEERIKPKREVIGDSYTLVYNASLAELAQAQRHRTIRYTMLLREAGEFGWYVPEIIKEYNLTSEWLDDINSVSYCIPQGTVVRITEQGLFEDFALKCKERMCGRAQLEIMRTTGESISKFGAHKENLSYNNKKLLEAMTLPYRTSEGLKPCARCCFSDFKCTEGCFWGAAGALSRLV